MSRLIANIALCFLMTTHLYALAAFPGAEGMGAAATGGRGGTVYKVTNLNDSGAGSFRDAVSSGSRIIVFAVSGLIDLQTDVVVTASNITVAGQTSPGGICFAGRQVRWQNNSNIIITHIRSRLGSQRYVDGSDDMSEHGHAMEFYNCTNFIVDHCSFSWGIDETVSIHSYTNSAPNPECVGTFSACIVAEGMNDCNHPEGFNHGMGLLVTSKWGPMKISLVRNLFASSRSRLPEVGDSDDYYAYVEGVNNVTYNWMGGLVPNFYYLFNINWISNYIKAGPIIGTRECDDVWSVGIYPFSGQTPAAQLYMTGNTGCRTDYYTTDEWLAGSTYYDTQASYDWRSSSPFTFSETYPVTVNAMNTTYASTVVADAGANKCFSGDCRDSRDTTIAANYEAGEGSIVNDVYDYPTAWPTYSTANDNPTDTDSDGMWDTAETTVFGNLSKDGTADSDSDGYTDFEEYLFYLGGYQDANPVSRALNRVNLNRVDMH